MPLSNPFMTGDDCFVHERLYLRYHALGSLFHRMEKIRFEEPQADSRQYLS